MTPPIVKNNNTTPSTTNPPTPTITPNPTTSPSTPSTTTISDRADAIRREIAHAMGGYVLSNFGGDEFYPLTQSSSRKWGLGLSIVDALDTLILAGNEEYVDLCIGFVAERLKFEQNLPISTFEMTIRGLGGLLSAYSLRPEHTVLLERAYELGELLLGALGTEGGGFATNNYSLGLNNPPSPQPRAVSAEILTLQIEFETLGRYTGEFKFVRAVRRYLQNTFAAHTPLLGFTISHSTRPSYTSGHSTSTQSIHSTQSIPSIQNDHQNDQNDQNNHHNQPNSKLHTLDQDGVSIGGRIDSANTASIDNIYTFGRERVTTQGEVDSTSIDDVYTFDHERISISGGIDSAYEYYLKLWLLHSKPPYRLPLPSSKPRTITWMGLEYSPEEQQRLWRKYEGLYDEREGVYIPLHLYMSFLLKFPSLLQTSTAQSLLFSAEINHGEIKGKLGHLDCFMGGVIALGISSGVLDDPSMINQLYQADCIHRQSGIPCDFIRVGDGGEGRDDGGDGMRDQNGIKMDQNQSKLKLDQNQSKLDQNQSESDPNQSKSDQNQSKSDQNDQFWGYYHHQVSQLNTTTDFIPTTDYLLHHHQRWANDLTHTCAMIYGGSKTGIGNDDLDVVPTPISARISEAFQTSFRHNINPPEVQDLYQYYRWVNGRVGKEGGNGGNNNNNSNNKDNNNTINNPNNTSNTPSPYFSPNPIPHNHNTTPFNHNSNPFNSINPNTIPLKHHTYTSHLRQSNPPNAPEQCHHHLHNGLGHRIGLSQGHQQHPHHYRRHQHHR